MFTRYHLYFSALEAHILHHAASTPKKADYVSKGKEDTPSLKAYSTSHFQNPSHHKILSTCLTYVMPIKIIIFKTIDINIRVIIDPLVQIQMSPEVES